MTGVLHLAWEYPPRLHGGLGRHVHGLARALARRGAQVCVVTNPHPGAPADAVVDGVRVVRVDAPAVPTADWVDDVRVFNRAAAASAHALLAGGGFDVLHAHDWMVAPAAGLAAAASGVPLVATIHATEQGRHQGWLPSPLSRSIAAVERSLVRRAAAVNTCSRWMAGQVTSQLGAPAERVTVVPNATEFRPSAGQPREPGLIAFAGRLEYEKGVHVLLEAAALLPDIPLRLVITGDGTYRESLEKQAAALGLDATFTGFRDAGAVALLFAGASIVVVPSIYEPFGLTALEAMASGAPLVVAGTGGLAELVTDGRTGLVTPPGDAAALASALSRMLTDHALRTRLGNAARAQAAEHPTWEKIATATLAVYTGAWCASSQRRSISTRAGASSTAKPQDGGSPHDAFPSPV